MTTTQNTSPITLPTTTTTSRVVRAWPFALIASGVLSAVGGGMHPEVAAEGNTAREELAVMTADASWVPGHSLLALGVALMLLGLWGARRSGRWPRADSALGVGVVVLALYLVEAVLHTAAAVDSENLAHGHSAPVALTHLGLAAFLYPLSGAAIVWMATAIGADWGRLRVLSVVGIVGGTVHAVVVPLTLLLPDTETSPLFAVAGMSLSAWALVTGVMGLRGPSSARAAGATRR
ncbi:hypothetical protein GCM10009623_37240 [Nocardioides aestuarii]|uniref:DUF4386 family protein n=1 Tax=Nocardioides aestuarii TaxID=252231 RepID=A0ABW4TSI7_9ACTN